MNVKMFKGITKIGTSPLVLQSVLISLNLYVHIRIELILAPSLFLVKLGIQ